jgi:SAM-dependent methyltransferase
MTKQDLRQRLYDSYVSDFTNQTKVKMEPYYKWLIKRIGLNDRNISILDFACGNGSLLYFLKSLGYKNIKGVDISKEQVQVAHSIGLFEVENIDGKEFLSADLKYYDMIFLMDILEHFTKGEIMECLDLFYSKLKANGQLVVHIPNAEGTFGMSVFHGDLTHEQCFTQSSIIQILRLAGFTDIKCFEEHPVIHGIISLVRFIIWYVGLIPTRLLYMAESGNRNVILSKGLLVVAVKN